jgi:thiol-disulfide isomerase/thioredoxin
MSDLQLVSEVAQWAIILLTAAMVAGLVYLTADIRRRLGPDQGPLVPNDGLGIGERAPVIEGADARSGEPRVWHPIPGHAAVIAFLSPTCAPCVDLVPHLNRLARSRRDVPVLVVVLPGRGAEYGATLDALIAVLRDADGRAQRDSMVSRTPLVFAIAAGGFVAMRTVSNDLIGLEDTLYGFGEPQGNRPWVPSEQQSQERWDPTAARSDEL